MSLVFDWEIEIEGLVEWMEVFDPNLGRWESLPNPPSYCEFRKDRQNPIRSLGGQKRDYGN